MKPLKLLELATKLERNIKEVETTCIRLGLPIEGGEVFSHSSVLGTEVNLLELLQKLDTQAKESSQKQGKLISMVSVAEAMVVAWKTQQVNQQTEAEFSMDEYFQKIYGIHPCEIQPGSFQALAYQYLKSHEGAGTNLVAQLYGALLEEAKATINGTLKKTLTPTPTPGEISELEQVELTIGEGVAHSKNAIASQLNKSLTAARTLNELPTSAHKQINGSAPSSLKD